MWVLILRGQKTIHHSHKKGTMDKSLEERDYWGAKIYFDKWMHHDSPSMIGFPSSSKSNENWIQEER